MGIPLFGRAVPFPRPDLRICGPLRAVSVKDGRTAQPLVLEGHEHSGHALGVGGKRLS
jgi:hypothetical protein